MDDLARLPIVTDDGQTLVLSFRHAPVPRGSVLLVHGFAQNRMTWHSRQRSLVDRLVELGFDVYCAELRGHGLSRRSSRCAATLADYFNHDLPALMAGFSRAHRSGVKVIVGHSLGGLMAAHLGLRYGAELAGIALMASPGRVRLGRPFALARVLPRLRRHLPGFRFLSRLPFRLDWIGVASAFVAARRGEAAATFPISPWAPGSMEEELLLDRLRDGFDVTGWGVVAELAAWNDEDRLAVAGVTEDFLASLAGVTGPVLLVDGDLDEIVPRAQSLVPEHFPSAAVTHHRVQGFGHCDLILGAAAPSLVWPGVESWLATLA